MLTPRDRKSAIFSRNQNKPGPVPATKPSSPAQRRVLIVDDNQGVADSLAFMLSHEGYQSKAVYSGEDAIEQSKLFKPDMLIADVIMPGMNGIDAAAAILGSLPACKVVLFSGHSEAKELINQSRRLGQNFDFVEKPMHPEELVSKLRFALV